MNKLKPFWLDTYHKVYITDMFDVEYYVCQKCNQYCCGFFFTGMIEDEKCFTLIDKNQYGSVNITCVCVTTQNYEFCCYHPTNISISSYKLEPFEWQFLKYWLTDKVKQQIVCVCKNLYEKSLNKNKYIL